MTQEVLKLALEAFKRLKEDFDADQHEWEIADVAITAIKEALAQPTSSDYALGYSIGFGEGHSAGKALAQHDSVQAKPEPEQEPWCMKMNGCKTKCEDCPVEVTEQEPVGYATKEDFYHELERRLKHIREEMKIKSVTMRCKEYDIALPIIDTDFGRVLVGQVSTPPQRTFVGLTDEEMTHTNHHMVEGAYQYSFKQGAKWAEAKLKEKNT